MYIPVETYTYAVLIDLSVCYPPSKGRFPRVTHPSATGYCYPVRLACVKHTASVRPEPGSNSPLSKTIRSTDSHLNRVCLLKILTGAFSWLFSYQGSKARWLNRNVVRHHTRKNDTNSDLKVSTPLTRPECVLRHYLSNSIYIRSLKNCGKSQYLGGFESKILVSYILHILVRRW